jgi:hypothetical protein
MAININPVYCIVDTKRVIDDIGGIYLIVISLEFRVVKTGIMDFRICNSFNRIALRAG